MRTRKAPRLHALMVSQYPAALSGGKMSEAAVKYTLPSLDTVTPSANSTGEPATAAAAFTRRGGAGAEHVCACMYVCVCVRTYEQVLLGWGKGEC